MRQNVGLKLVYIRDNRLYIRRYEDQDIPLDLFFKITVASATLNHTLNIGSGHTESERCRIT